MKKNPLLIVLGLSAFFFVVFVAIAVGTVVSLTGTPSSSKQLFGKSNFIGVLEIKGVIMDAKKPLKQIETFAEDESIKGVLVHINSPGGAVGPSQEIYDALVKLAKKKPVYSSMGSLAASGGYYAAVGTKRIFANPGTITGSIGVIMQFADLSKLYQWAKVNPYSIKTGRYKDIGSPSREMNAEEKALLQEMIDNVLGQFRKAVATGRNLSMEKVIELSDGRIYSGEQAKNVKLVDDLGGFNDAVEALAKEAGITGKPKLVYASKSRKNLFDLLDDLDGDAEEESRLNGLGTRIIARLFGLGNLETTDLTASQMLGPLYIMPQALGR